MTKEKIWKIARGLRKFTLDEMVIISESSETEVLKSLSELITECKLKYLDKNLYVIENQKDLKSSKNKSALNTAHTPIKNYLNEQINDKRLL